MVTGGPHSADSVKVCEHLRGIDKDYLSWLAAHQPVYFTVRPAGLTDAQKASAERETLKKGLVCTDRENRFRLTEAGAAEVERIKAAVSGGPLGGVSLADIDAA